MASTASESSPLIQPSSSTPRPQRNVTFNPEAAISPTTSSSSATTTALRPAPLTSPIVPPGHHGSSGQPMLSALNSKLRRRNSHGSPLSAPPMLPPASKIGPQRTTKNAQKLKLLPNPDPGDDGEDEESGRDVYSQFTRIKDPTARRDAARLGKADRDKLPRVTAYCTANAYRLEGLMKFLKGRGRTRGANPKLFDECIYSPYSYGRSKSDKRRGSGSEDRPSAETLVSDSSSLPKPGRRYSDSVVEIDDYKQHRREELIDLHTEAGDTSLENGEESISNHTPAEMEQPQPPREDTLDFDTQVHTPEVFLFEYGTVVIWGMTLQHEQRFLKDIAKFETEKLGEDDVQTENFNFYYTREYQARIYNDFISLREKKNYMTKLAISHALSQSVKVSQIDHELANSFSITNRFSLLLTGKSTPQTSLFEELVSTTISQTTPLPAEIATTGSISLSRRSINMKIGELFILRINIHLQGSVLDSPELMWAEPHLEPVYGAMRSYLEMDQRVGLLTERLDVLGDLLAVLKDQVRTSHGEALEWIVIILIAAEILVAAINIVVDLYAGID
ncbi:hypothetical protein MMC09_002616 [Bachmanniomyces sp. S44760]|nr:hypothetical protein [Bachmanniomyces sp. S44760]